MILRCAAILFDLDGVLVTSTVVVARQWTLWAAEHNLPAQQVIDAAHGRRTVETVRFLAPHLDADAEAEIIEKREAADMEGVEVIPGTLDLLASLPAGRWAVVTSGTRYLATTRLANFGIAPPAVLVTANDVHNGKPHPEPYLKGAKLLGFPPEQCVVFEDAPAGIEAAHAAGMRVIALPTTYPADALSAADALIPDLSHLRARSVTDGANSLLQIEVLSEQPPHKL